MNAQHIALQDQLQLLLLRWLTAFLSVMDALLGVNWGERLLDRLSSRWQSQLAEVMRGLESLERERGRLHALLEAMAIQVAAIHLGARKQARGMLRLDPADSHDERILDASIDLLVKRRLAAVETQEVDPGHYVYNLEPDWSAIRTCLADARSTATPEIAEWLSEGLQFIDDICQTP